MTKETLTKPEIQFWMPIIISIVSVVGSFSLVMSRIAVLENKVDNVITLLETHSQRQTTILANLNDLNYRVTVLETMSDK